MTTGFAATVTTAGDATVNSVAFDSTNNDALTIAATADSATLTTGTVTVTDKLTTSAAENNTVEVSGDTDGVTVEHYRS